MTDVLAPLRAAIAGRLCVVVGAAPLDAELRFRPNTCVVVVNGGISSVVGREPDVWVLNSRSGPYAGWHGEALRLSALMLAQGAGRAVGLAVLLTREDEAAAVTLAQLGQQHTHVAASIAISQTLRRALESAAGARTPAMTKYAISAGVTAAALCLLAGASTVVLEGVSWDGGYAYDPAPVKRGHVFGDQCALAHLQAAGAPITTTLTVPLRADRARLQELDMQKKRPGPPKTVPAKSAGLRVPVRVTKTAFYEGKRRYTGEILIFTRPSDESGLPSWAAVADADAEPAPAPAPVAEATRPPRQGARRLQPNAADLVVDPPAAATRRAADDNVLGS